MRGHGASRGHPIGPPIDSVATRGYIAGMKHVGVRDLKNRLSEYLRAVKAGERVLVTDRGEVVAELGPPGPRGADPDVPAGLLVLARQGMVTLAAPADPTVYRRLPRRGRRKVTSARLLDEDRGTR